MTIKFNGNAIVIDTEYARFFFNVLDNGNLELTELAYRDSKPNATGASRMTPEQIKQAALDHAANIPF